MALRKRVLTSSNGAMHLSTSRGQHEIRVTKDLWAEQSWNPKGEKPAKMSKGLGGRGHWDRVYTSISQALLCGAGPQYKQCTGWALGVIAQRWCWVRDQKRRYRNPEEQLPEESGQREGDGS